MTRDELIQIIQQAHQTDGELADAILAKLPRWIPVTEQLPADSDLVVTRNTTFGDPGLSLDRPGYCLGRCVHIRTRSYWMDTSDNMLEVTHWIQEPAL